MKKNTFLLSKIFAYRWPKRLKVFLSILLLTSCSEGVNESESDTEKSAWHEEGLDFSELRPVLFRNLSNISVDVIQRDLKIPSIVHRVWITNPNSPRELPEKDLAKLEENIALFKSSKFLWDFKLWTNVDSEKIPLTRKRCTDLGVEIINVASLKTELKPAIERLILKKRFVVASDTIRIEAVRTLGGVYVDNDYRFYNLVDKFVTNYDSIFGVHLVKPGILGNAFIAASAGHPILERAHRLLLRNLLGLGGVTIPQYISCPTSRMWQILTSTGPWMLTLAAHQGINQSGMKDLVLPYGIIFMWPKLKDNPPELLKAYDKNKVPYCPDIKGEFWVPGKCAGEKWIDVIGNDDYSGSWSAGLVEDPIEACPVPLLGL